MATSKVDRSKYGPGMGEVVLGAVLSLILGAMVALGILISRPALTVKEIPKDRPLGAVYYIEGTKGGDAGKQWMRKRQLLTEGTTVSLNEDELNLWIGTVAGVRAAAAGAGQKAASAPLIELGTPNFRIRNGAMQVASPCTVNLDWFSIKFPVLVQVIGHFAKRGDAFVLTPDQFYVGSCPLHKVPVLGELLYQVLVMKEKAPPEIAAAWKKLAGVSIDGNTLKLTMP